MGTFDRYWAAVCKRGHTITDSLDFLEMSNVPRFCADCGAPVVTQCESCSSPLLGGYRGSLSPELRPPDPFCYQCGAPHRWASREQRVGHLENLLEFEDLDEATQLAVIEQLAVLTKPVDEVEDAVQVTAADRIRKMAPSFWNSAVPVLQSVLSEAAKRTLGL